MRLICVQCSRCRRRKIKCTGDPGDGSGCSACRSAGADRNTCTFNRVRNLALYREHCLTAVRWEVVISISCQPAAALQRPHQRQPPTAPMQQPVRTTPAYTRHTIVPHCRCCRPAPHIQSTTLTTPRLLRTTHTRPPLSNASSLFQAATAQRASVHGQAGPSQHL